VPVIKTTQGHKWNTKMVQIHKNQSPNKQKTMWQ